MPEVSNDDGKILCLAGSFTVGGVIQHEISNDGYIQCLAGSPLFYSDPDTVVQCFSVEPA